MAEWENVVFDAKLFWSFDPYMKQKQSFVGGKHSKGLDEE